MIVRSGKPDELELHEQKIAPLIDSQLQASYPYLQQKNFCSFACLWHGHHLLEQKAGAKECQKLITAKEWSIGLKESEIN
jgi:hypothetical protein